MERYLTYMQFILDQDGLGEGGREREERREGEGKGDERVEERGKGEERGERRGE